MMKDIQPKKSTLFRLISLLFNAFFWQKLYIRITQWLFPAQYPSIKLYDKAMDARMVGLDGKSTKSLLRDFIDKHDVPLVLNVGSYN
jgi:hypothetical protein